MKVILVVVSMLLVTVTMNSVSAQAATPVQCGDIVEDEFTTDGDMNIYTIEIQAGTSITVQGDPLGDTLDFIVVLLGPDNSQLYVGGQLDLNTAYFVVASPQIQSGVLSANGNYSIIAYNNSVFTPGYDGDFLTGDDVWSTPGGVGVYTLFIGCTLRDGTVIEPGDTASPPAEIVSGAGSEAESAPAAPEFSGFGFPGVASVDFGAGIEIPLALGQPQTLPLANDIALYTYTASADEVRTLTLARLSGDISMGVTVINKDSNEIIFVGGLPSSDALSVALTFPSDGVYALGLFRFDTTERGDTSGAVQLVIE